MITVEAANLTKVYKTLFGKSKVTALNDFSLSVNDGEVFGLLGPNGAGKTTFIKILLGIVSPTMGSAKILGEDISHYKIKQKVGYLPENHKFPPYLTGEGLLKFIARLNGVDKKNIGKYIDELLDLVKMTQWRKMKIKKYSKGMMQRIGLAQALINDPQLIFLDEPTDGVDPIGRKEIRDMLKELKERGKTIFLNSHLLSEIELITDRVAILNKGKLIREGSVTDLTISKEIYEIEVDRGTEEANLQSITNGNLSIKKDSILEAKISDLEELNKVIDRLRSNNINIKSIIPQKSSLEDYFINIIKDSDKEVK